MVIIIQNNKAEKGYWYCAACGRKVRQLFVSIHKCSDEIKKLRSLIVRKNRNRRFIPKRVTLRRIQIPKNTRRIEGEPSLVRRSGIHIVDLNNKFKSKRMIK